MFHSTLTAALAEATPAALRSLAQQGVTFLVGVESANGEFFLLHADDREHGERLARNWVDVMGARGCSLWAIKGDVVARRPVATYYPDWDEAA